ncbi:unnamed protein product [Clonostachys chloroleuca]|uniref:ENTH domain-containing protein n=1 Tax=Clonostachys chloroleuca TaxID=1926264 RepID=A0AA35M175_9HYPO|nr:unnamed protein product [Clonostachys chloroleuca]
MECRSDRGTPKREPRPNCNEGKLPKEVVPEDFNEGVSAAKLLVEGNISEAPSLVQLQKIAERTLESPPEAKGVMRSLEFYFWYSDTVDALLVFRALQVLDYLVHCGPRVFENWAKGNIDRLQEIERNEDIYFQAQELWALTSSYAQDLVRVLSDPELLMVERSWSELWASRVEATIPVHLQVRTEEIRIREEDSRDHSGYDQQLPPYPGPRATEPPPEKPRVVVPSRQLQRTITPIQRQRDNVPMYPKIGETLSLSTSTQTPVRGLGDGGEYFVRAKSPINTNPTIPEQLLGARVSSRNAL